MYCILVAGMPASGKSTIAGCCAICMRTHSLRLI